MHQELVLRYRDRKLGQVAPASDRLAYQRVLYLPLDLAVLYSAVQNFRLDLAKGYYHCMTQWTHVQANYFGEVYQLFQEDRRNHFPGNNNDEPWIHVFNIGKVDQPSERVMRLKKVFDEIFLSGDPSKLDDEHYPTPFNCVTNEAINRFYRPLCDRLQADQKKQLH